MGKLQGRCFGIGIIDVQGYASNGLSVVRVRSPRAKAA